MRYTYQAQGTCSQLINLDVEEGIINDVSFVGGCNGNLQGISKLIKGMKIDDVIDRLEGIRCGYKATSCPDQLCQALKQIKELQG
ncbi:MAG: TIGR03905 family TSCPD domain-containing protein [Phocaeicola sp.]|uniref:TIGR03905 family TSCPD domain-containing protein n=1 Tax=Phocaeicola TaxID=909656 RepID=UPI00234E85A1|nr:TIGR03905 family TSCPD domain-containing protein [Phocaeicola oris]MCE2616475.1 TIGR03905 family TSCPD domain-containing protein [Phocaeicola oris]